VRADRPDIPALVAGLALLAFGGVLLLDALDAIALDFGLFAPVACAVTGAILLANGLSRRE
jgi:Ca2+/Na+ antiporter